MPVRAADRHQVTRCMVTGGLAFSCPAGGKILPPPLSLPDSLDCSKMAPDTGAKLLYLLWYQGDVLLENFRKIC